MTHATLQEIERVVRDQLDRPTCAQRCMFLGVCQWLPGCAAYPRRSQTVPASQPQPQPKGDLQ